MMKYLLILSFLFVFELGFSQAIQHVVIDNSGDPDEPSVIIDPKNIQNIVAGANIDQQYYSHDGGITWNENVISSTYGVWGDPVLAVDTNSKFLFLHLSDPSHQNWGSPNFLDRIIIQSSSNDGVSFQNGNYFGRDSTKIQDKPWIAIDPQTNYYYVTWTQFDSYGTNNPNDSSQILFSMSTDGGLSWTTAKRINRFAGDCVDSDGTAEGAVPSVGPNGEVYVVWSTNDVLYFDKSLDHGNTWLGADVEVCPQIGGWDYPIDGLYRANGLPVSACDVSGGLYNGTIYINWSDNRNGDHDVFISKSTDGGNTWSTPLRVNDDPAGKEQFMSWMTIDQTTGNVYVVFYDRRNYNDNFTDVYMAVSTDGGNTFSNFQISNMSFDPGMLAFIGDYTNVSASHNKIIAVWTSKLNGVKQIEGSVIQFADAVQELNNLNTTTRNFLITDAYPNPGKDFTITFTNQKSETFDLYIQEIGGKKKYNVFQNKHFEHGNQSQTFSTAELKMHKGTYLIVISDGKQFDVKKIVVQ